MVFEPNFTKVVSSVRKNIGITQSVIELKLPTNDNDVSKVYSVGAKSTIVSSEVNGREVSFVGLVDFQAMYESNGLSALDYSAEFKDRFVSNDELMGEVVLTSNVVDVTSSIVSNGIKVVAIIEVTIDAIVSKDINALTGVNNSCAYLSTKEIEYSTYLGKASEKFEVTGDVQLKNATKVLMVTPCATILNVEPKENYLIVSGVLNAEICYQTGDDTNDISSSSHSLDFSCEVALNGIEINSTIQSAISIISNEIKISTSIEESGAIINMFVPIVYTGYIFNQNSLEVIDDIYSEKHYLSVTTEKFDTLKGNSSVCFKDNISGTASIMETAPFIDDVLGVCTNNIVLASSRVENGKLNIEGITNATVVYYTKETNSLTSVQVEMPFSIEEKVEGEISSVVTICLNEISARSKRGKEIEVSAELNVYADMYGMENVFVISDVLLGDEKPVEDCSLFIYIVKPNQTLWDVAKEMSVSQEMLIEQNPEVELPLKANDKLVVYKPRVLEF